jgi:hypothetical protein
MPGQLPTLADAPLIRLNSVDLPVLGMPNSAIRFMQLPLITQRNKTVFNAVFISMGLNSQKSLLTNQIKAATYFRYIAAKF